MKKYLTVISFLFFIIKNAQAQNLVPNPSFETYVNCPSSLGSIPQPPTPATTVSNWFRPSCGSSDYFNACSATAGSSVPNNTFGHQPPRTGNGYVGAYMQFNNPAVCREYLQTLLNSTLIAGHEYYVSFWVSLADWQPGNLSAINQIAAYFNAGYLTSTASIIDNVTPQIINTANYIGDTLNWTQVSGTFVSNGTENCIVIGNFNPFTSQTAQVISGSTGTNIPYYYFDDICVFDMTPNTHTYDTSLCGLANGALQGRSGMQSFLWNTGDTSQSLTITAQGTYWVKSFGECEAGIDTFHVLATGDTTKPNLGRDTSLCFGQTLLLDATNAAFNHYSWNTGDTTAAVTVSASGVYWVAASNSCGTFTDSISVTVKPPVPPPPSLDTIICTGAGTNIKLPYGQPQLTWHLEPGDAGIPTQPPVNATAPGSYLFYVSQTQDGCTSDLATVKVKVLIRPQPARLPEDTALCSGNIIFLGQPQEGVKYLWNTGDTSCCIQVNSSGSYWLKVSNYCDSFTSESTVTISNCSRCIWAGNAFSPNGDGLNDRFEVKGLCPLKKYQFRVFNRYGQEIFFANDIGKQWDGTFKGMPCDAGTYYYYLEADVVQQEVPRIKMKGDITLIR